MTAFGAGRINPRPCTDAEEAANWRELSNIIQEIYVTIDGGVVDNFTVKSTSGDSAADYLHDAFTFTGTYDADADPIIAVETDGAGGTDQTETAFLDADAIPGYSGTGTYALCEVDGVATWVDASTLGSGGGDNFKVKLSGTDTTDQYVYDKVDGTCQAVIANYVATEDSLIKVALDNAGAVDQDLVFYFDGSTIPNYASIADGEAWPIVMERSGSTYTLKYSTTFEGGSAGTPVAGTYIDVSGMTISVDVTEIADHNASNVQFLLHLAGEDIKWKSITGYDAAKTQVLGHVNGAWQLFEVGACD